MRKIKKDDIVKIISGSYKNQTGRVIKTDLRKNRILVEGINMVKKHIRPSQENPQGGIIEKEAAVHISNVMLVVDGKVTKIGYKSLDDGKKVKFAKSTGEVVN